MTGNAPFGSSFSLFPSFGGRHFSLAPRRAARHRCGMPLPRPPFLRRIPARAAVALAALAVCVPGLFAQDAAPAADPPEGTLFGTPGGWGVSTVPRAGFAPVAPGRWAGRLAGDAEGVIPPPSAPFRIPRGGNPWKGFAVPALSLRFSGMLAWQWARTGALPEGGGESFSFKDARGKSRRAWLRLEDAETRRLRQGRIFSHNVGPNLGNVFLFAGSIEEGAVAWHVVTGPTREGPLAFQVRLAAMDGRERLFTLSVRIEPGEEGGACDVFLVPYEPRDATRAEDGTYRVRLALTPKTLNFPSVATVALSVGGEVAPPPPVVSVPDGAAELDPCTGRLDAPEGTVFRDVADALAFLELRAGGLFEDADDFEAMASSLARDGTGAPRVALEEGGRRAVLRLNPDPDLETSFNPADPAEGRPSRLRPNHAARLLAKALAAEGDVVVRAIGEEDACDYALNALRMADHPGTWEDGGVRPTVRLSHAECEFVATLARRLHAEGRKVYVRGTSPGAFRAAAAADGLAEAR